MVKSFLFVVFAAILIIGYLGCGSVCRTNTTRGNRISPERLRLIETRIREEVAGGKVQAASICIMHRGTVVLNVSFGRRRTGGPVIDNTAPFIIASITKTVTAAAVMLLVERGIVCLDDPVKNYIPEFSGGDRDRITVRMLLTHTSGLPDQLPENSQLRQRHEPLSSFHKLIMTTPLLYAPGTDVRYQSTGIALAALIVERVTGSQFKDFVKEEIFTPLGMTNTFLGLGGKTLGDVVMADESPSVAKTGMSARWDANSIYWREIGNPWGGLHSTTSDMALFFQTFLDEGIRNGKRWMGPATVAAMTRNWNSGLPVPWGLGFGLGSRQDWRWFGDLISDRTFGHYGSIGTLAWADPDRELVCVIFTTRSIGMSPVINEGWRFLKTVSNMAAAAAVEE
ncbi:MAG: serine hydrolase domain-containing protein [Candidatus Latescibacterota bacterium]